MSTEAALQLRIAELEAREQLYLKVLKEPEEIWNRLEESYRWSVDDKHMRMVPTYDVHRLLRLRSEALKP